MSALLFYQNPVALNRNLHGSARIAPLTDFGFARATNSVAVTTTEFVEVSKEYPLVFAKAGDSFVPVALLGVRENENLFVSPEGAWDARYIPAFVRRYPFALAETPGGPLTVCVDAASPLFNAAAGEALFTAEGTDTPFFTGVLNYLHAYQAETQRTEAFMQHLDRLGLLREMTARADLPDGRKYALTGLYVVDEQKLQALEAEKAHALVHSGEAGWLYAHLLSLTNMSRLLDRLALREKASA